LSTIRSLGFTIVAAGDEARLDIELTQPATCVAALSLHRNHPGGRTTKLNWLACRDFSAGEARRLSTAQSLG
jgi:hypothetical protein